MLNILHYFFKKTFSTIKRVSIDSSKFRIEEIDTKSKKVVLSRRGMQTILKIPLLDAVKDKSLVARLKSDQACWLGYYCGKMCRDSELKSCAMIRPDQGAQFELEAKLGKYKIMSQDRKGKIIYFNRLDNTNHAHSPLDLISNRKLINEFDPSQACYIGMLAGLLTPKQVQALTFGNETIKPFLRLVE